MFVCNSTPMKPKLKLPPFGTLLLIAAPLSNVGRWVGMYLVSDNAPAWVWVVIPFLNIFSALSTALVIAGGLAFVAHRIGGLQPFLEHKVRGKEETKTALNIRFWSAAISGLGILAMSAFLLPPYIRMMLPEALRAQIGNVTAWSVMSVLVGDLIIVAIAATDSKSAGFTRTPTESKPTAANTAKGATDAKRTPKKSAAPASKWPQRCKHCDEMLAAPNAVGGHMKKHHPDKCKQKPLAVGLFESVSTDKKG